MAVAVALAAGAFFTLLVLAEAMAPEPAEIRVEVSDALAD